MLLADVQGAHEAEVHEAFAGTAFWVAVLEVPAGGSEGWSVVGGGCIVG